MQYMTMEEVRVLDGKCGEQVLAILFGVILSNFADDDNACKFKALAEELHIEPEKLAQIAYLLTYVKELSKTTDATTIPSVYNVAMQFGLHLDDLEEFEQYVQARIETIQAESVKLEQSQPFSKEEMDEIRGRGFTFAEWGEYTEDLQQDAGCLGS